MEIRAQGGMLIQFSVGEGISCFRIIGEKNKPLGLGVNVPETFFCQQRENKLARKVLWILVENKYLVGPACVGTLPGLLVGSNGDRSRGSNIIKIGTLFGD
jgi:hypothetical protein